MKSVNGFAPECHLSCIDHRTSNKAFHDTFLHDKAIVLPNRIVRGINPVISYRLWNKIAVCRTRLNIANQDRNVYGMEIEIVTSVIHVTSSLVLCRLSWLTKSESKSEDEVSLSRSHLWSQHLYFRINRDNSTAPNRYSLYNRSKYCTSWSVIATSTDNSESVQNRCVILLSGIAVK